METKEQLEILTWEEYNKRYGFTKINGVLRRYEKNFDDTRKI